MTRLLGIAASGLQHQHRRLEASAHNTSNLATAPTAVLRASASEIEQGNGVETTVESRLASRPEISGSTFPFSAGAAIDSAGEQSAFFVEAAVEQITALHHSIALGRAVQAHDEMLGILVDLKA